MKVNVKQILLSSTLGNISARQILMLGLRREREAAHAVALLSVAAVDPQL